MRKRAGRTEATGPDGTTSEFALASDPRWQSQAPWARTARVRTPQGRSFEASSEREVAFEDPAHPHRITSLEQRHTINGRTSTARYYAAARTITSQNPGGQQRTVTLDELGRVLRVNQAGKPPYIVEYDGHGRIATVQHGEGAGARITRFHYDESGNLAERIDPLQRTHIYEHDVLGRLRAQEGPDGARIALDYDAHDNLTKVVPPGRLAHEFRYTAADSAERYIPPALAGVDAEVGFRYDADLAPERADGPGDQRVTFHHDQAGRIERVTLARGDYVHEYDPATGELAHLSSPDAVGLHFGRDGPLLREDRWSTPGAPDAVVSYDYDDAFRLRTLGIQDAAPIEHGYDANDALTQAGPLTIVRNSLTSLPDITRAGAIETDLDVSQFGEPERFAATFAGQPLYEAAYTRDALGRITHLDEIIAGQARSVAYDYDDADRLAYVEEQGQPSRELLYDPNGNLVEIREAGIPVLAASHDAQDRLRTHGHLELTYTDSGHLETKLDTRTGERTTYRYDEFGSLLGVELADSRSIQYLIDGADRRVAKLVDGELPVAVCLRGRSAGCAAAPGWLGRVHLRLRRAGARARLGHQGWPNLPPRSRPSRQPASRGGRRDRGDRPTPRLRRPRSRPRRYPSRLPAIRVRWRPARCGHGPRPLRRPRLRARARPLDCEGSLGLRWRRHEPLRLRLWGPGQLRGPERRARVPRAARRRRDQRRIGWCCDQWWDRAGLGPHRQRRQRQLRQLGWRPWQHGGWRSLGSCWWSVVPGAWARI